MRRRRATLLVVDDEPAVLDVVAAFLEDDYDLIYADNGQQGLISARSEHPDLILLDIGLPDINGYELCWMLKTDPDTKNVPVVFVTAFDSAEDEAAGLAAGAVDYIAKPINPVVLKARVKTQVEVKLQRDCLRDLVKQDAVTDLPNRRFMEDMIQREWRRAVRAGGSLSLIAMQIDDFDRYKDEYGVLAADSCLQSVAAAVKPKLQRGGDYLGRYADDLFVALLADTPFAGVGGIAAGVHEAVKALEIPHNAARHARLISLSVAAVSIAPHPRRSASTLIRAAVDLLGEAARAGGNRVETKDLGSGDPGIEQVKKAAH